MRAIRRPGSSGEQRSSRPSVWTPHRLTGLDVIADQRRVALPGQVAADRAPLVAGKIDQEHVALGRAVEFDDLQAAEALEKTLPYVGTHAIAGKESHRVVALVGLLGG